jgi:uncharacterized protein
MKDVTNDVGSEPIRIRAHHLLCMQGFQGLGYSQEFTENMAQIIEQIIKNPSSFIKVTSEADSICECCPHNFQGICNKESTSNNIKTVDSIILEKLDLEEGSVISWPSVTSLTMNLSRNTVQKLCENCSWRNKCLYFQEKVL